jgi:transcription elongation factor Elf1
MDDEQLELFVVKKTKGLKDHKFCPKCNKEKHVSCFTFREPKVGKAYRTECKECENKKQAIRTQLMRENPKPIDPEYRCPICNKTEEVLKEYDRWNDRSVWVLDHSHVNNTFRGWICNGCNIGLGRFNDNVNLLEEAIKYLQERSEK